MDIFELYESSKARFEQLQAQGKRSNYPASLKADVLSLLEHYSPKALCNAFGICEKSIRNWLAAKQKSQQRRMSLPIETKFATLKLPEASANKNIEPESSSLTLLLGHGLSLVLPKQPVKQTAQLINALIKELSQCSI